MKKSYLLIVSLLLVSVLLGGCTGSSKQQLQEKDNRIAQLEGQVATLDRLSESQGLLVRAMDALQLLKSKDFAKLSSVVHPEKGLRFTPYPYIDLNKDKLFTAQAVAGLASDTTVYQWGSFDGSGEPIKLNFTDYYAEFVYDHDFTQAEMIGNNRILGQGNTTENVKQAYPNGKFIEFYFSGFDPKYEGIDWSSLKLVFEQKDGVWFLVGIVHGQWTV